MIWCNRQLPEATDLLECPHKFILLQPRTRELTLATGIVYRNTRLGNIFMDDDDKPLIYTRSDRCFYHVTIVIYRLRQLQTKVVIRTKNDDRVTNGGATVVYRQPIND